ncbi:MAG: hypothetical protein LKI42_05615 [Bacteroidales bacterium]|nr:hypothetical protein [Bacteroidales bacterium]MCI1785770.1 hypothetical protein [Bacteroidales bacterium]
MTDYSFILLNGEQEEFLERIREFGVMDITRSDKPVDPSSSALLEKARDCKNAIALLGRTDYSKDPDIDKIKQAESSIILDSDLTKDTDDSFERLAMLKAQLSAAKAEVQARKPWGLFDKEKLEAISESGYKVGFHIVPSKRFDKEWASTCPLEIIRNNGSKIFFVTITKKDEEIPIPVEEIPAPAGTFVQAEEELNAISSKIIETKGRILALKEKTMEMKLSYDGLLSELDLYLANVSSETAVENKIVVLQGFAPVSNKKEICSYLDSEGIFYIAEKAKAENNPPVKLKNNWFASIFELIGNFYMLPKYDELDLTPFFAPFYMLFFGFCLGDFGYGTILLALGIAGIFLFPKFKKVAKLVALLGAGAMIMALLNGPIFGSSMINWFGINPDNNMMGWLKAGKDWPMDNLDMFWFSMIFGLVQIIFGRIIAAVKATQKFGWQAGLSNVGWIAFIIWISLYFTEWYHGWDAGTVMKPWLSHILLAIAGIGVIFFSKISGNFFLRILKGVASIYDVTGLLGDVLSYIRLFALGVSGGILGSVFNSMALQLGGIPYIGWFFCLLLLIVGHLLVMFLSSLSAFVHPMRLTFVEFYKNANFEGGGRSYKPLIKK